jgi:hypothetical protein
VTPQGLGKAFARALCLGDERVDIGDGSKRFFNDAFKEGDPRHWPRLI